MLFYDSLFSASADWLAGQMLGLWACTTIPGSVSNVSNNNFLGNLPFSVIFGPALFTEVHYLWVSTPWGHI